MPRQQRLILPDVAVHIVQRGNNRAACFLGARDYRFYLRTLRGLSGDLACAVHAYCLMTNHVHLLLTPPTADACRSLMKNLGQLYVQCINRSYGRTGTLWEGRYRSCLAQSARYVLACYRYIELNPVRAAMVGTPGAYPWSSYRSNAEGKGDSWLRPSVEFLNLDDDPVRRRDAYRALIRDGMDAALLSDVRNATSGGYPLGTDSFIAELSAMSRRRVSRGRSGRPKIGVENRGLTPIFRQAAAAAGRSCP
jgi:putative transposase